MGKRDNGNVIYTGTVNLNKSKKTHFTALKHIKHRRMKKKELSRMQHSQYLRSLKQAWSGRGYHS